MRLRKIFDKVTEMAGQFLDTGEPEGSAPAAPSLPPSAVVLEDAIASAAAVAARTFPDNPDVMWTVARTWIAANHAFVAVTPVPAEVGYPEVALAFRGDGDHAAPAGTYVPGKNAWQLLSSDGSGLPSSIAE